MKKYKGSSVVIAVCKVCSVYLALTLSASSFFSATLTIEIEFEMNGAAFKKCIAFMRMLYPPFWNTRDKYKFLCYILSLGFYY